MKPNYIGYTEHSTNSNRVKRARKTMQDGKIS